MLYIIQFIFAVIIGLYFWNLLRSQHGNRSAVDRESRREMERLQEMRRVALTEPLSEKTRPTSFDEIIGQKEGLKALRAALCGSNPQHVIIYGPPGVGKTAAARLVLEEAKANPHSPFKESAKFIEIDATTARFDERGIADPLIGSVHDPIYQGAGPLGMAGIPQPKPGAVTKAHGGILFIDEIGELHPIQMNKLLKVLEDRKVFLESAYYNPEDPNIPRHIHDIFQNGLPADFRLVGATTRMPQDIPPAIRSRCVEIFFRALTPEEIDLIARNATRKIKFDIDDRAVEVIKRYATNGREAVNIIQIAAGIAQNDGRETISVEDIEWVVSSGQYNPRPERRMPDRPQVGVASGLAVFGPNMAMVIEIEVATVRVARGEGQVTVTGVIEEEEMGGTGHRVRRKSMAKGSVDNVITVLRRYLGVDPRDYDIHINFPGGVPVDGPSAGVAVATAIYSALTGVPVDNKVAMTGELSIRGQVKPVGGIAAKIEAARWAGAERILIPKENWQEMMRKSQGGSYIIPVRNLGEVLRLALLTDAVEEARPGVRPLEVAAGGLRSARREHKAAQGSDRPAEDVGSVEETGTAEDEEEARERPARRPAAASPLAAGGSPRGGRPTPLSPGSGSAGPPPASPPS
ncbi:MAG TPA: ATP-dependent protease LonB [Clostridiales bacterium]|nr:ATP-dependent protease LonB [Clostridiales bacterium]